MEQARKMMQEFNHDMTEVTVKGGVGIAAAATSMTINDWVGLGVGIATFVYMLFQIEAAWRKRKIAIQRQKEYQAEKAKK